MRRNCSAYLAVWPARSGAGKCPCALRLRRGQFRGNAAATTEQGKRYQSLQKFGAGQTKADIAAKRKEAIAEIAQKKAAAARP